jgi:hypothetical protein
MILMAVSDDDAEQVLAPLLDEAQIRENQIDAGISGIGEGHAEIHHDPLAVAAVQIDVHSNLARPAEGQEEEFVTGSHSIPSSPRVSGALTFK